MLKIQAATRLHAATKRRAITPEFVEALLKSFGVDLPKLLERVVAKGFGYSGKPKISKARGELRYHNVPNSTAKAILVALTKKLGKPDNPKFPEWEYDGLQIGVGVDLASEGKDSRFNYANSYFSVRDLTTFKGYGDGGRLREDRQSGGFR